MKKLLVPLLLLFCALPAAGQGGDSFLFDLNDFLDMRANKSYAKSDTTYIGRYPYHWDARTFYKSTGMHVVSSFGGDINLSTGMINRVGVGISYRGLGLSYSFALGRKLGLDLSFDSYGRHFCFEYSLKATKDLKGTIQMAESGTTREVANDLLLIASKLNLFWSFNPRFSYAAAMKQTRIQRRSAGSVIAAFSWAAWDLLFTTDKDTSIDWTAFYESNYFYQRFSLGLGYGYNLVLGKEKWLIHASLVPMWTFYEMQQWRTRSVKERINRPYGWFDFAGTARAGIYFRWTDRWSIGFSGVVNQWVSSDHLFKKAVNYHRFGAQEWQMRLSLAYRF